MKGEVGISPALTPIKWETFRAELSFMFADLTEEQHVFMLLRHAEQDKNELIHIEMTLQK